MDTIGARFKYLRKAAGQDQKSFAAAIGISQGTLSDIENGKCRPSAETLISVCRYCRTSSDWVLSGIGKDPTTERGADSAARYIPAASEAGDPLPDGEMQYIMRVNGDEKDILEIYREFNQDARTELRMFMKVKLDYLRMKAAKKHQR